MASVQYLFCGTRSFQRELITAQVHLHKVTISRISKIILIQRIWRGFHQRKIYQQTRKAVITIQAYFRGWRVRANMTRYKEAHDRDMGELQRINAAIKLQAWWRGIRTRQLLRFKGVLAVDRINERKRIAQVSENMAAQMRQMFEENEKKLREMEEAKCQKEALVILYKCHHLIRTYVREGIYSLHGKQKLSEIEVLMKSLPCKDYMDYIHVLYKNLSTVKAFKENYKLQTLSARTRSMNETIAKCLENKPRSVISVHDEPLHNKPFIMHSKICSPRYEKSVITCKDRPTKPKSLYLIQREKGFVLNPKMVLKDPVEPYYIDFWESELKGKKKNSC